MRRKTAAARSFAPTADRILGNVNRKGAFRVATGDPSRQLQEHGIIVLRDAFAKAALTRLKEAAVRCFQSIATEPSIPERYGFNRSSHSVLLTALMDFGCAGAEDLTAPLSARGLEGLFSEAIGAGWTCNLQQSWVRKKFAPHRTAIPGNHLQDWHQDGALGVRFPTEPGPVIPMTELLTLWIPLTLCGMDSPGLEFIRRRQPALVHFTQLDDSALRRRFPHQEFWAPTLEFGDGLVFLNDILHRTYTRPEMEHDRLSVEYRIFPVDVR
jgi:hypothetical protein